jgi:hypothetical protein
VLDTAASHLRKYAGMPNAFFFYGDAATHRHDATLHCLSAFRFSGLSAFRPFGPPLSFLKKTFSF